MVSAVLISEIGDFKRFPQPDFLASYAGVVPRVFQSDTKIRYGKITKQGSVYIRYALINASWVAVREDRRIREIFIRIAKRAGRKKQLSL
jgi:transposase